MVELRTLTPSVLVRIQLPQPKFKRPAGRFNFGSGAGWFKHATNVAGSKTSRQDKHSAVEPLRFPRSRRNAPSEGISCPNQDVQPFVFLSKSNGFFKEIQAFLLMVEFESINFKKARFWSTFELRIRFPVFSRIVIAFSLFVV